jgi:signal transduction histidine kinase
VGWAAVGVLAVFCAVGYLHREPDRPLLAALTAVAALGCGAAAILGPRWLLLPAAAAASAAIAVLADGDPSNLAWFGVCLLAGWCVLVAPPLTALCFWFAAMVLLVAEAAFATPDPGWSAWLAGTCFSVAGCYFGQRQRALVEELRRAQAGLAQQARVEERNRIARELHDVIAHSLTVSLLHVTSARLALADDPADAARALAEAERLGRASLAEVRHAVGLLRESGAADPLAPLPGSLDVAALLAGFRTAGADITARIEGDLAAVPATVGLAAYRIVQEALTNAAKHAPAAPVTVVLESRPDRIRIEVDSAGTPGTGHGLGVIGMQERAASVGGRCTAGPGGSGWLVRAELPVAVEQMSGRP